MNMTTDRNYKDSAFTICSFRMAKKSKRKIYSGVMLYIDNFESLYKSKKSLPSEEFPLIEYSVDGIEVSQDDFETFLADKI